MYNEDINFSLWCDFVERGFLKEDFPKLLQDGIVNGATSNPSIFKSAFLSSDAYKEQKELLLGKSAKEVYEALAIEDIKAAADEMKTLYEQEDDGFISIEVDPFLCDDAKGTIEEGKRLYKEIGKSNVMIKVPATDAGYEAMEALMKDGIHVNATLIFSPEQAKNTIEAFGRATKDFKQNERLPQGVISVFVSRFDGKLDGILKEKGLEESKVGIYNAAKIYNLIESYDMSNVRTLFASTGVKRDDLQADYYIKELLFANCVNTAPLNTIKAFVANKECELKSVPSDIELFFEQVKNSGVDMQNVYNELMQEGLLAFKKAFDEILKEL